MTQSIMINHDTIAAMNYITTYGEQFKSGQSSRVINKQRQHITNLCMQNSYTSDKSALKQDTAVLRA